MKMKKSKSKIIKKLDVLRNEVNNKTIITIGPPIIPETIGSKETIRKSSKLTEIKVTNKINELMDVDENNHVESTKNCIISEKKDLNSLPHFYSLRNKVICIMKPQCKFAFHGKLKIKVLYGGVTIYGTTLLKSNTIKPIDVYSPSGSNFVNIQAITLENSSDNSSNVWNELKTDNVDCNVTNALQSDINNLQAGWAVIIMQNFENNLTTFFEMNCNYKLFPKIDDVSNYSWSDIKRAEIVLQTYIYCDSLEKQTMNFTGIDETTNKILIKDPTNNKNLRVVMAGGKSVGKSTTTRYFVNRILEKFDNVIVLDLDPGQSEFTPPGCISLNIIKRPLLGPNFTHLQKPYHQIYIGSTDVVRSLSMYINGLKKLVKILNTYLSTKQMPVIVNTIGFVRGVGWDIIISIIKSIQPTDVIQIVSERTKNNFDQLLNPEIINNQNDTWAAWENSSENVEETAVDYQLHIVNSQAEIKSALGEMWNIEPHQKREISMLAYLSEVNKHRKYTTLCSDNIQMNINGIVPYQVPFSAVKLSLGHTTTPHALSVMNGNIIALCGIDSDNEQEQSIEESEPSYPEILIRLPLTTCYGFGILRGVDMDQKTMYINTPLSINELKYVNCLIGCMPVPSGLLQLNRTGLPYIGGDYNLPTSRDPRRGYFRMKYRNDT
ncbi:hypothetical protein PV325_001975 [Microctonus aethiopoides]|nr:hypothetical protein PV325_001975 [Microctonus aethiopoides]